MRIPFLRPKTDAATPPPQPGQRARNQPAWLDDPGDVEAARIQARRRLVGALVLLVIGVLGFPVLFETQPRPLPMDTPMVVAHRDAVASGSVAQESAGSSTKQPAGLAPPAGARSEVSASSAPAPAPALAPAATPNPAVATPAPAAAVASASLPRPGRVVGTVTTQSGTMLPAALGASAGKLTPPTATPPAAAAAPLLPPQTAAARASASQPVAAPSEPLPASVPLAQAASSAVAPAPAASATRWVVQAGVYNEPVKLRDARARIEQLGLKTYTQVIEGDKGKRTRVRVGPFATKAEAEATAAQVKKTGLPVAVLVL